MGFLNKLKESFGEGKRRKQIKEDDIKRIHQALWNAVRDGIITSEELGLINLIYQNSELEYSEFEKICSDVFVEIVKQAIADRRVTEKEENAVFQIAKQLQLNEQWQKWAQEQMQYYALFAKIEAGEALPTFTPPNILMQKNETCHLYLPAEMMEERVIKSQYVSGSRGVSIRIMKGVSYRVGQSRGRIETEKGLVAVSNGYFVVTNKRLIFAGNNKSITTDFTKLLNFQVYSDALQYFATNRQKPIIIRFGRAEEVELSALVISRLINDSF